VIYGSKDFVDRIKKDYLSGERKSDIPVLTKIVDDVDISEIIKTASAILKIDNQNLKVSRRISKMEMINRDMLVYLLWQSGHFKNSEIGDQVGLTISSVSRRVGIFQELLDRDKELQTQFEKFKSIIKV